MAFVDADGLVHTDDEDDYVDGEDEIQEYDEDEEVDEEDEYTEEEDGLVEEVDDEDDEDAQHEAAEYIHGLQPLPGRSGAAVAAKGKGKAAEVPPWAGLKDMPAATQTSLFELLERLRKQGRTELTILLLGKCGVGKSSTANSLFKERVAQASVFQGDIDKPAVISRQAQGFTLTIIDTPGLLDADAISQSALDSIAEEVKSRRVDAVLWVDRLDVFRVESLDRQAMSGVTRMLGKDVWQHTLIALTHGKVQPPSLEQTYDEFVEQRAEALRAAARGAGAGDAALPVVLVENSSRCDSNADKEAVLPNGGAWLPALMRQVVQLAATQPKPFAVDPKAQHKADPAKKRRWLIPLVLAAQIALKVFVLDRLLEEDRVSGDQYGPYDPEFVKEERERLKREKEARKRYKELEAQRKRSRARQPPRRGSAADDLSSDEEEEGDYEDDSE